VLFYNVLFVSSSLRLWYSNRFHPGDLVQWIEEDVDKRLETIGVENSGLKRSVMKTYAFKLKTNQDLRGEIDEFVKRNNVKAGVILTCVGNLKKAIIRIAESDNINTFKGSFTIVSLTGILEYGDSHLHISFADNKGKVFGGHLKKGSIVGKTAEIVIGELEKVVFERKNNKETGYHDLVIKNT